jgi:formylglycine-generating enzyme required for sulfatase activity
MAGGTYEQGCGAWTSQCNHDEKPVRWVTLGPFWIGRTEVTQAQWRKVMGANPSQYLGDDRPVEQVSWTDAQEFVRRLNTRSESGGETFRLLSEAEWEFACRSGGMPVAYGTRPGRLEYRYARYGAANGTVGVGLYPPNPLGLHDLSGNVWEWTQDAYDSRVYANGPAKDPVNVASASVKVLRGGGWSDDSVTLRCTYRGSADAHSRSTAIGIRLAMTR